MNRQATAKPSRVFVKRDSLSEAQQASIAAMKTLNAFLCLLLFLACVHRALGSGEFFFFLAPFLVPSFLANLPIASLPFSSCSPPPPLILPLSLSHFLFLSYVASVCNSWSVLFGVLFTVIRDKWTFGHSASSEWFDNSRPPLQTTLREPIYWQNS